MTKSALKSFVLTHLFPQNCAICKKRISVNSEYICIECIGDLPKTSFHKRIENPVKHIFKGILDISAASSFLYYKKENLTGQILYQIKYSNNKDLAVELGRIYAEDLKSSPFEECDAIIALPLHPAKESLRGYNQAVLISQGLSEGLKIPLVENAIVRTKNNISQTKLTREERALNVENIFKITDQKIVKNKKIILVDDVVTTGATLEMAGKVLIEAGIKELYILTLACAFDL